MISDDKMSSLFPASTPEGSQLADGGASDRMGERERGEGEVSDGFRWSIHDEIRRGNFCAVLLCDKNCIVGISVDFNFIFSGAIHSCNPRI